MTNVNEWYPINPFTKKPYRLVVKSQKEFDEKINSQIYDFTDSLFLSDIEYSERVIRNNLDFTKSTFTWNVVFKKNSYSHVKFQTVLFKKDAIFSDSIFWWECNFWESKFEWKVNFSSSRFDGKINFTNAIINKECSFWYSEFKWEVFFINSSFDWTVYFYNASFKNKTSFILTKFNKSVTFSSSIFELIPDFRFQFCKEIDLHWVRFEKGINFLWSNIELPSDYETARVIKFEFQKLENQFETLSWHAKEMKAYHKWLRRTRDILPNENHYWFKRDKKLEFNDEIILLFNWITNNHWLSWIRPVFFIFWINLIFNLYLGFNFPEITTWQNFILTLNPVKSLKELDIDSLWDKKTLMEALSFLKNIVIWLLLYQLISGFRKFSRKF